MDTEIVSIQPMKIVVVIIIPGASLDIIIDDNGTTIPAPIITNFDPINGLQMLI